MQLSISHQNVALLNMHSTLVGTVWLRWEPAALLYIASSPQYVTCIRRFFPQKKERKTSCPPGGSAPTIGLGQPRRNGETRLHFPTSFRVFEARRGAWLSQRVVSLVSCATGLCSRVQHCMAQKHRMNGHTASNPMIGSLYGWLRASGLIQIFEEPCCLALCSLLFEGFTGAPCAPGLSTRVGTALYGATITE
jgi:hypothetical protein